MSKYFLHLTYLGITTTYIQDGRIHWSCDKSTHLDVSIFSKGNVLNSTLSTEFTSTKYARWPLNAYFCHRLFWKRIRPMQWLTPIIGFFHNWATVLATTATDTKGAPIPGPAKLEYIKGTQNTVVLWFQTTVLLESSWQFDNPWTRLFPKFIKPVSLILMSYVQFCGQLKRCIVLTIAKLFGTTTTFSLHQINRIFPRKRMGIKTMHNDCGEWLHQIFHI